MWPHQKYKLIGYSPTVKKYIKPTGNLLSSLLGFPPRYVAVYKLRTFSKDILIIKKLKQNRTGNKGGNNGRRDEKAMATHLFKYNSYNKYVEVNIVYTVSRRKTFLVLSKNSTKSRSLRIANSVYPQYWQTSTSDVTWTSLRA